jgi:osmoprotectant transport system ATP-binding protein
LLASKTGDLRETAIEPVHSFTMTNPTDREAIIEFRDVTYRLPDSDGREVNLLECVSFTVWRGETLVLLGRSGAGKTTALKLINRLLEPSEGEVRVEGKSTRDWDAIALRRRIGYVIQETGLFPHYTVEENVAMVPRLERWPANRIAKRVNELLEMVGLDAQKFLGRYPHELSGGQRQRVGLARALAADPDILLMDEPFGALDAVTRAEVRGEFQSLKQRLEKTIVIVTHDIHEAVMLATRIALVDAGKITGSFSPEEFLRSNEPAAAAYREQVRELESAGHTPHTVKGDSSPRLPLGRRTGSE